MGENREEQRGGREPTKERKEKRPVSKGSRRD